MKGSGVLVRGFFWSLALVAVTATGLSAADFGQVTLGDQVYRFEDQIAFHAELTGPMGEEETMTVVLLASEAIDREAAAAALREDGIWQGPDAPRVQLRFRKNGRLHQVVFQGDANNVIQPGFEFDSKVEIEGGKARGSVATKAPLEFFEDEFEISVTVDAERLDP